MAGRWKRYFIPGFVIRTVLIGATYATGREVTEFFLRYGPFSAFIGLIITTTIYSLFCILAFELARRFKVLDYRSFCEIYMGRWWFLYEFGFIFGVILTLATIGAAAGEFAHDSFGIPRLAGSLFLMGIIGVLVYLGTDRLERFMSWWSIAFYTLYAVVVVIALYHLWGDLRAKLIFEPVSWDAIIAAVTYALFNCAILPVVIFVARHLESRSDSVIAGALAGPLLMLPGLALLFILIPFYPKVVEAPLPVTLVLQRLGISSLSDVVKIAIVIELAFNGAALLHGVNERIAASMKEKGRQMPNYLRSLVALSALIFSAYIAERIGLITLVAAGFRSGAYAFLAIMLLPLLTRGFWMIFPRPASQ
jgi:uncharacterized membrane protein YkvI